MGRGVSFPRPPMPSQYPARPRPPMPPPTTPGPAVHMTPHPQQQQQPPVSFSGPPPPPSSHRPVQPGGFAPPQPPPPTTTSNQPPIYARPAPLPASHVQPSPVTPSSSSASSVSVGNQWRTSSMPPTTKPQPFSPQVSTAYHPGPPPPQAPPMTQGAPLLSSPYRPVGPNQRPPYPNGGGK